MVIVDIPSIIISLESGYADGFSAELDTYFFSFSFWNLQAPKNLLVLKVFEYRHDWHAQYFVGIAFLYLWICCFYGVRIIDDPQDGSENVISTRRVIVMSRARVAQTPSMEYCQG